MLLGIRSKKVILIRHLSVAALGAVLVYLFYLSYPSWGVVPALWPEWNVDHAFWRSFAHAAFVLLFVTLIIGPLATIWPFFNRFISWRRELGIWFAVLSVGHGYAIWDRWALWDIQRFFGFEYIEALGGYALLRPEVGIMNMMAVVIFPMIILLAITSSDRAVQFLGISSWKWLHNSLIHSIFYVVVLRWVLYAFFFFQPTLPDLRTYPPVWPLYPFLWMALCVVIVQAIAFVKTIARQRSGGNTTKNKIHALVLVGISLLFISPVALVLGSVAFLDSRIITEDQRVAQQRPQNYARSFHMVIREETQDVYLWVRDIDSEPYFRQTINVDDSPVAHQIYRYDEQALYTGELDPDGTFTWSKDENIRPEDLGLANIIAGPALWALELGPGEQQIPIANGTVPVSIMSVEEPLEDEIFTIPVGTN